MNNLTKHQNDIFNDGFTIVENIYTDKEIKKLIFEIDSVDKSNSRFRKTNDLFAIRQFLKEVPNASPIIFNQNLKRTIDQLFGAGYFVVKSIYFDKPEKSNWFVAWHQDLTISVDKKEEIAGYSSWTVKQDQFAVQPPINILKDNFTVRIHIDNTDEDNGALKVISGSHENISRVENIDQLKEKETICNVKSGGVMIMRPLLLHASNRTVNDSKRRVVHIEFSKTELPDQIKWSERMIVS